MTESCFFNGRTRMKYMYKNNDYVVLCCVFHYKPNEKKMIPHVPYSYCLPTYFAADYGVE